MRTNDHTGKSKNAKKVKKYCEVRISENKHTAKPRFRSTYLKKFPSVKKLTDYLLYVKSGSSGSVKDYVHGLSVFCNYTGKNPEQIINLDPKLIVKMVNLFCKEMKKKEYSLNYIVKIVRNVKTFLKCNGLYVKLTLPRVPPRYRKKREYISTPIEAKKMMEHAGSLRNSAIMGFLAFAGLRNSTLRALQYSVCLDPNFPRHSIKQQLENGEEVLAIVIHPEMKKKVESACKGGIPYYTFIPKFVTEKLKAHLNHRIATFGKIGDDEFLFPTTSRKFPREKKPFTPISSVQLVNIVREAARNAGLAQWKFVTPHSLRKTFKMWLLRQPEATLLSFEEREFLMGHIPPGSVDEYFDKIHMEDLREQFSKLVLSESDYNRAILQAMCTMLGIDFNVEYSELKKKLGREPSLSEMGEIVKRKLHPKQIPVPIKDVPKYLEDGWGWVAKLDDETAILKK